MIFEQIPVGKMQNFCYIIGDEKAKECAVIDPAWEDKKILDTARKHGLQIKKIILTHTHYDHTEGCRRMQDATGAEVVVHKEGLGDVKQLGVSKIHAVEEGEVIKVGKLSLKVIHTPGHIPSMICLLAGKKLLTGDTLFVEGCGRIDLPGGDVKKHWESLQRIKIMDDNIEVYPGHDYGSAPSSTIKQEKKSNPYLKFRSFEEFLSMR